MRTSFRIFKTKHGKTWFDGEGARRFGGRWNSPGWPMLYSSASLSLAALEVLVHLDSDKLISAYSYASVTFDEKSVERVEDISVLPSDWSAPSPERGPQEIGDEWLGSGSSLILSVPSVIIPGERNYLINVDHPNFGKLKLSKQRPFIFDDRLINRIAK